MPTITEIAAANPDFEILTDLLVAAGLDSTLDGPGDLTVFAPTDAAFAALAISLGYEEAETDSDAIVGFLTGVLTELGGGDPTGPLTDVLTYHVSPGARSAAEIRALSEVATLQGGTLRLSGDRLVDADPSAPDPRLALTDIAAENGVVHAIDGVLLPLDLTANNPSLGEIVGGSPDFTILAELLATAGLLDAVSDPDADLTVFAPTDTAFSALARRLGFQGDAADASAATDFLVETLAGLDDGDPLPLLGDILTYHVSPGGKTLAEISGLAEVTTLNGAEVTPMADGTLGDLDPDAPDPTPTTPDVAASNGIAHVLDGVLLPFDAPTFEVVEGGGTRDALVGGAAADNLVGGGAAEVLAAGGGDDLAWGGGGADLIFGGGGDDTLSGGARSDMLRGGAGADRISGDDGADRLFGGDGADALHGGAGGDRVTGGRGADMLKGGAGADRLFGGDGADVIDGGAGADVMSGGAGGDLFRFGRGDGFDRVSDFETGVDALDLTAIGFVDAEALSNATRDVGRGVRVDLGEGAGVLVLGVTAEELEASVLF